MPKLKFTPISAFDSTPIDHLWPRRIPRRTLTLIIGDPGLGKSYLALDIAARVSRGSPWPFTHHTAKRGKTIVLSAEDSPAQTLRKRLRRLGADLDRIFIVDAAELISGFSLGSHLRQLEKQIRKLKPRLLVIDPLSAYLDSRIDPHREADVRHWLAPLFALAQRYRIALIGIMHLNKGQHSRAIYRAAGSIGFVAAARAVYLVAKDPLTSAADHRVFAPVKYNLGPMPTALGFRIHAEGLHWTRRLTNVDANELLQADAEDGSSLETAEQFLKDYLRNGAMLSVDVFKQAAAIGISRRTLEKDSRTRQSQPRRDF